MILIHRITPFFIGLFVGLGFVFAILNVSTNPFLPLAASLVLIAILFARLLEWKIRQANFWYLIGIPLIFLLSSYGMFALIENQVFYISLAILSAILVFFYAENIFKYTHLSAAYQAYSIEHLSLVINILTIFFITSLAFGTRLFLQVPLYILVPIVILLSYFVIYATLWVSKIDQKRAIIFALVGAVIIGQLFTVATFLPAGFYTSAALITIFFYLYLGIIRAHFLEQLSPLVLRRYLILSSILFVSVVGTSSWV